MQKGEGKKKAKAAKQDEWTTVTKKKNKPTDSPPAKEQREASRSPASSRGGAQPPPEPLPDAFLARDVWVRGPVDYRAPPKPGASPISIPPSAADRELIAPKLDEKFGTGPEGMLQTLMERVLGVTVLLRFQITITPEQRRDGRRVACALLTSDAYNAAALKQLQQRWSGLTSWRRTPDATPPKTVVVRPALSPQEYVSYLIGCLVRGGHRTATTKSVDVAATEVERFLRSTYSIPPALRAVSRSPPPQPAFGGLDKELMRYMFSYFDPTCLALARRVCVAWHRVASDARLWADLGRKYPELKPRMAVPARARFYSVEPHNDLVMCRNEGFGFFKGVEGHEHILVGLHASTATVLAISA